MIGASLLALQVGSTLVIDVTGRGGSCVPQTQDDLVVCARGEDRPAIMPMTIDGKSGRLLVEAGAADDVICNPDFIARAGLTGRGPVRLASIGPVEVSGAYAKIALGIAGRRVRQNVRWSAQQSVVTADCVTGPRDLGYRSVRFLLGPERPDATRIALPFFKGDLGHIYGTLSVGREMLAVRFEPRFALSVLTAPAARAVAPIHGGTTTGAVRMEPIAYGVARPVRPFDLHRPFRIGGLVLSRPYVRVADYGEANGIRSVNPDEAMPDDIVVARMRKKPGRLKLLRVGGDDLARCVSITVDMKERQIVLVC